MMNTFNNVCGSVDGSADTLIRQVGPVVYCMPKHSVWPQVSVTLGSVDSVSEQITGLARRRLLHGTLAIVASFALPGLLAAFSLTHVRIVVGEFIVR